MSAPRPSLEGLRIDRTKASATRGPSTKLVVILVALLALAAAAWWWFHRETPLPVRTATVREIASGQPTTLLNASGYVTARRLATVSSKITGKIVEVLVEEGTRVDEGQILARLDDSNTRASLALAEAQVAAARTALAETDANLALAELELRRQTELSNREIISPADLDRADANARALRGRRDRQLAEIAIAERQLDVWRQQLEDTIIRAPFAGVVTYKNAQPGEMISPMSSGGFTRTGVCTIVDMSSLEIEIDVNESYINRVEAQQPVVATLDSYPDWKIPARVIAIIPSADRQKATVRVRVGFDQLDPRILPDMGVKVAFQAAPDNSAYPPRHYIVPRTAVRSRNGRDVVYVVRDRRATSRAVTIISKVGDEATLSAGVSTGERIIVEAPESLTDNTLVADQPR
jgi:RND family efflux transporter, MFP subunit